MEQFGLAIIFFFEYPVIASAFTSGTINGTLGSYLYRELLSITIQFLAAAFGANFFVASDPMANRAISQPSKFWYTSIFYLKIDKFMCILKSNDIFQQHNAGVVSR